jgi:toxin ParE1/3/4
MKLIWTEPAVVDLENIKAYIAHDSELYAAVLVEKIIKATEKLRDFPKLGREVPEFDADEIREIIFSNYRIMYRIQEDTILIVAVIHGKRDLMELDINPWEII